MSRLSVPGCVHVNGALAYDDPSIYLSDKHSVIRSGKSDFAIPIIELYWLNAITLVDAAGRTKANHVHLHVDGNYIGETHDLSGYAAVDSGECVRVISQLDFQLEYLATEFRIRLAGRAGDYIPATCHGMSRDRLANSAIEFSVELRISDDQLIRIFAGKTANSGAQAMIAYRNQYLSSRSRAY